MRWSIDPAIVLYSITSSIRSPLYIRLVTIQDAVIEPDCVRLTPQRQSKSGMIWNQNHVMYSNWEVEIKFRQTGQSHLGADGWAFWTSQTMISGDVFGSVDMWNGLGIFFDTYSVNGAQDEDIVGIFVNDETYTYESDTDGMYQNLGHCKANLRNRKNPNRVRIRYKDNKVTVHLALDGANDFELCASADDVHLSPEFMYGMSSHTGDVADAHDIFSFSVKNLTPGVFDPDAMRADYMEFREKNVGDSRKQFEVSDTLVSLSLCNLSCARIHVPVFLLIYLLFALYVNLPLNAGHTLDWSTRCFHFMPIPRSHFGMLMSILVIVHAPLYLPFHVRTLCYTKLLSYFVAHFYSYSNAYSNSYSNSYSHSCTRSSTYTYASIHLRFFFTQAHEEATLTQIETIVSHNQYALLEIQETLYGLGPDGYPGTHGDGSPTGSNQEQIAEMVRAQLEEHRAQMARMMLPNAPTAPSAGGGSMSSILMYIVLAETSLILFYVYKAHANAQRYKLM